MITLGNLKPAEGATRDRKRIGRGPGSGTGKTAGRGMNGQKSRSGYSRKRAFEGGQMPINRRIPKRGFTNKWRVEYTVINLAAIEGLGIDEVTLEHMIEAGLVKGIQPLVKILGDGELTRPVTVHAHRFSKTAMEKIEKSKGKAVVLGGEL